MGAMTVAVHDAQWIILQMNDYAGQVGMSSSYVRRDFFGPVSVDTANGIVKIRVGDESYNCKAAGVSSTIAVPEVATVAGVAMTTNEQLAAAIVALAA